MGTLRPCIVMCAALFAQGCGEPPPAAPSPSPRGDAYFEDATERAGIRFTHRQDRGGKIDQLPQTLGPGVASFDMDGDGWQDQFLVQGREGDMAAHLYRGEGLASPAREVAALAGADVRAWGQAVLAEDLDGDGYTDLAVTSYREPVQVLWNQGDGTFRTAKLSAAPPGDVRWWSALAALDLERDGLPDLYVGAYVDYGPQHWLDNPKKQEIPGLAPVPETMLPGPYTPAPNALFRNEGARRFRDDTKKLRVANESGRTLGLLAADLDEDGWQDIFVANDVSPCALFRNKVGSLEDFSARAWVGEARGSMGLALGDPDGDGALDIVCTHWIGDVPALYANQLRSRRRLAFIDTAAQANLANLPRSYVGWGVGFLDFQNDGIDDLLLIHGHTSHDPRNIGRLEAQPSVRMVGREGGRFDMIIPVPGGPEPSDVARVARGAAFADLDRDGRVDVVVSANNGPASVWRSVRGGGRWVALELVGTASMRSGLGAQVELEVGNRWRRKERASGESYFSSSEPVLRFGLGSAVPGAVRVRWPSGRRESFDPPRAGAYTRIVEGTGNLIH